MKKNTAVFLYAPHSLLTSYDADMHVISVALYSDDLPWTNMTEL